MYRYSGLAPTQQENSSRYYIPTPQNEIPYEQFAFERGQKLPNFVNANMTRPMQKTFYSGSPEFVLSPNNSIQHKLQQYQFNLNNFQHIPSPKELNRDVSIYPSRFPNLAELGFPLSSQSFPLQLNNLPRSTPSPQTDEETNVTPPDVPPPLWMSRKRKCWCPPEQPCKYCRDHSDGGNRFHRACAFRPESVKKKKKLKTTDPSKPKKELKKN